MRIPHTLLSSAALQAVIEEFVTRDGTDHSSIERRIDTVLSELGDCCVVQFLHPGAWAIVAGSAVGGAHSVCPGGCAVVDTHGLGRASVVDHRRGPV